MTTARPNAITALRTLVERALLQPHTATYRRTLAFVLTSIVASIVALTLETVHPLHEDYLDAFELRSEEHTSELQSH